MSYTITSGYGSNNDSSHVLGYENNRLRYETFSFTIPTTNGTVPITSVTFTGGTFSHSTGYCNHKGGTVLTAYFGIGTSFTNKVAYGTVNFSGSKPVLTFTKTCSLKPGSYNLYVYTNSGTYGWRYFPSTESQMNLTLTGNVISYTKCKAPTSITITPAVQKPGGTITVSWSGHAAGTQNNIAKYQISYKIGDGSWSTAIEKTTASAEITLPDNATRGSNIQARVKVIGSVSGYDSDLAYSSATASRVNSLPAAPTLRYSNNIISSTSGGVTLSATAGLNSETSQSTSIKYNTSNSHNNQSTYSSSITVNTTVTYYFWTYDGLEYSLPATVSFTKNSKPSAGAELEGTVLDGSNNYMVSCTVSITNVTGGQNSNNKYSYGVEYSSSSSFNDGSGTSRTLESNSTLRTYQVNDIRSTIGQNKYYKIWTQRYDGVEWGAKTYSEIYYSGRTFGISDFTFSNKLNNSTGISDMDDYFSNSISIHLPLDEGYNTMLLTDTQNKQQYTATLNYSSNTMYANFNISENSKHARGGEYEFQVCLISSGGYTTDFYSVGSKTRINFPQYTDEKATWSGTVDPFVAGDSQIGIRNFFNKANVADKDYKLYGFTSFPTCSIVATYAEKNKTATISGVDIELNGQANMLMGPTGQKIYDLFSSLGMNKDSQINYKIPLQIIITNAFGNSYIATMEKTVNWCSASNMKITQITYKDTKEPDFLKEDTLIGFNIKVKSYHYAPTAITVDGYINTTNTLFGLTAIPKVTPNGANPSHNNPVEYEIICEYKIPQQNKDLSGSIDFKFKLSNSVGQQVTTQYSFINTKNVYRHMPGQLKFISGGYIDDGKALSTKVKVIDYGVNTSLSTNKPSVALTLEIKSENAWNYWSALSNTGNDNVWAVSETYNFDGKSYITCRVKMETTWDGISYSSYTEEFTIYNLVPTISYRKNKVGINYSFPENDSDVIKPTLVVNAHSDADIIYLKSANNTIEIHLNEGKMVGVIIDCGTWDT